MKLDSFLENQKMFAFIYRREKTTSLLMLLLLMESLLYLPQPVTKINQYSWFKALQSNAFKINFEYKSTRKWQPTTLSVSLIKRLTLWFF